MKLSRLAVLADDEIRLIHESSLSILEECGVKILNPETLYFLEGKGCKINRENKIAYFSRSSVEDAVAKVEMAVAGIAIVVYEIRRRPRDPIPALTNVIGQQRRHANHIDMTVPLTWQKAVVEIVLIKVAMVGQRDAWQP